MGIENKGLLKARILHQNSYFSEALSEVENVLKTTLRPEAESGGQTKWTDNHQEMMNQLALRQWEQTKASMNQWEDLLAVSRGTEKQ